MSELFPGIPDAPSPPEPVVAAAVILWRDGPEGREVFWVRRGEPLRFAGGFHAFPGGRLDPADREIPILGVNGDAAGLVACACRELFEETGILLARGAGRLSREERDAARRGLLDGTIAFRDFLGRHGLALDAAALAPAGRWVTPPFLPLRYDAHLFLARLPQGEEAVVWPGELSGGEFVAAARALASWEQGEVLLHPPNRWAVECLARSAPPACLDSLRHPPYCDGFVARRIEFQKGIWLVPLRTPTLPPATHTGCYLLDLGGALAVVDPGSPYPEEQARLERLLDEFADEGLRPAEIWVTHHHVDHVGGIARVRSRFGTPVLAHPLTEERLPREAGHVRPIGDGDLLRRRWRVLHTPGHAAGHVAFHDERTGALLCGDLVSTLSTIVIDPPEGDMSVYVGQLERLRALAPRTLYPAHGPPAPNGPAKLEAYLAHRLERERKVLAALSPPATLAEVTRRAYDDTPAALHPLAARSCLASLEKLEREGRARREGEVWGAVP